MIYEITADPANHLMVVLVAYSYPAEDGQRHYFSGFGIA